MLSIHVIVDNASNEQLDMSYNFLIALQQIFPHRQLVVNIAAGAQLDKGMWFVERVRAGLPDIVIIWRHLEDTGIHKQLTPTQWYNSRVLPRLEWLQKNRVVILLDNESSGDDKEIMYYVQWEISCLKLLHAVGLNGAVARWATGNIGDGTNGTTYQYSLLKPLFSELSPGDWVSPNEYTNFPGKSSSGHLHRWQLMEDVAGRKLPITIGEAGLLDNYAARDGWLGKVSPQLMLEVLLDNEQWYREDMVRCLYCIGGYQEWATLQLTQEFLNLLLSYYRGLQHMTQETIKHMSVQNVINFRAVPNATGAIQYKLAVGEYTVVAIDAPVKEGMYDWQKIRMANGDVGYVALQVVKLTDVVTTPPKPTQVVIDAGIYDDAKTMLTNVGEDIDAIKDKLELDLTDIRTRINAALVKLETATRP